MLTQYRIVPKENFRWGVEKLVKPACWYTKAQWKEVIFYENPDIDLRNLSHPDREYEKRYRYMRFHKYSYNTQEEAEMYIDYELANEKKVNRHMTTPPREYP